ncbi:hypothetical protein [Flavobacterium cerinum]|uniref:Clan AA aspartic protease n=1 Tax=Flavobacterium cerinum TaxID=2502784 RepID=A0A3S3SHA7_9FLAO|nr:hypothetical protein [Flavobacterium cerinum]RWX03754.1 hypothetical protein EPI11_02145 [Flavobacterium cerinum]
MHKLTVCILVVLAGCCQMAFGQNNSEKIYTLPFELTDYNNLSVQVILNEKDTVHLMFHTAINDIELTEDAVKKLKSIKFDGTVNDVKSWGSATNESRFSKGNSVQIGAMKWENVLVWEDKNSGQHTDGKFGPNLFKDKAVEIDFEKKVIIVYSELPKKVKNYDKLKLTQQNNSMFLEATGQAKGTSFTNKFMIHSGYAGAVLFDDAFVSENKLDEKLKITGEKELKDSYGHVLKTKKALLPSFMIGNQKLTNVSVGFFSGTKLQQSISVLGGDVLKRFSIIFDAKREYIYLKLNSLKDVAYLNK